MTRFFIATATVLLTLLVVPPAPARAGIPHRYVEDFHTAQYKDTPNTTALWQTNLGELRLFKFVPKVVGSHNTPWYARDIWVSGDYAYVSDLNSGVQVFDISDPTAPDSVGTFPAATFASDIEIDGNYAFVADGTNGFRILDVSDPANPSQLSLIAMPGYARGATIEGDYAFVAVLGFVLESPSYLVVVDISDPERPFIAATRNLPSWAVDAYVSGDYVYVATAPGGLNIFSITDPANPVFLSNFPTGDYCRQVFVAGNFAYLAAGATGLRIVDVTNPLSPVEVGSYDTPDYAFGVILDGAYAYVADRHTGLMVFDVSDPTDPILVHTVDTPEKAIKCAYDGEYVYVADAQSGLQIIQVRENLPPLHVSTFATGGAATVVALNGRRAYIASEGEGLLAIDVADPEAPGFLGGSSSTLPDLGSLVIAGRSAFVTTGAGGEMMAFDITGVTPILMGPALSTGGEPGRMVIRGDDAFVANGGPGLSVIDISTLSSLSTKGSLATPTFAAAIDVAGNDAFLTSVGHGLIVVDITDPALPFTAANLTNGSSGRDIEAAGNTLYVADGLETYDIRDPSSPVPLGSINLGLTRALEVSGTIAYVAGGELGGGSMLRRIDVSDPANPTVMDSAITLNSLDLTLAGDYVYVADWTDGMKTFQVFQRWFNLSRTSARSIEIDPSSDTIVKTSLLAAQTDSVSWEISADGGNQWQKISSDGTWVALAAPGSDLRWRTQFTYVRHGNMPNVTDLSIDWLYEPAVIDSIVDVPGDRGGMVNIHLTRSAYDFSDEVSAPITGYDIFRRPGSTGPAPAPGAAWTFVGSIEASDASVYVTPVPTVADSSDSVTWSVYYVSARTSDSLVFFDSASDSGYSVDNLGPPNAVAFTRFEATYRDGRAVVSWEVGHARGLEGFYVYRAAEGGAFAPLHTNLLPATVAGEYIDETVVRGRVYRYRLGAVDADGEFFSSTVTLHTPAAVFALYPNHPNPFNPATTIPYSIANPGQATMRIYDVSGRVVRSLFDRYHDPGVATAVWDGRDDVGRPAASGVYFCRLDSGRFTQIRKLVLLK